MNFQVKFISCASFHTLALLTDGRVFAWGGSQYGKLGVDQKTGTEPIQIPFFVDNKITVKDIAAGQKHSLAVSTDGKLYSWGRASKCG